MLNDDRYNYIVPGICTEVDDVRTWDFQAQRRLYKGGFGMSAGFNYYTDVPGGPIYRSEHAAAVAQDLRKAKLAGLHVVAAGHSNGCYILTEAYRTNPDLVAAELHLIAAAVPKDCEANGLNLVAARHQVGRIFLYVSPDDEALGIGSLIGYGTGGRDGPAHFTPQLSAILTIVSPVRRPCKHNDWVGRDFRETVDRIATLGQAA